MTPPNSIAHRRPLRKPTHVGDHLRQWRQRRHLSQLDLAGDAEISARHLSFVETGRSAPSREMVLRLADRLDVPLRERNVLLIAAGFAPVYPHRALDDPELVHAKCAIDQVLAAHEPNPALAIDRHWNVVSANRMFVPMLAGVSAELLTPPVNVLRLSFHPDGLARHIVNQDEWCLHLLDRLHRQCEMTADPALMGLFSELKSYRRPGRPAPLQIGAVAIPFRLSIGGDVLNFISTTMIFGTPLDITLSEIAIESFFPADVSTAARLRAMSATE